HGGYPDPVIFNELCALKDEPGPCKAIKDRYFFNVNSGSCELFEYGGCGGNANNFETVEECEKACVVSDDKNPCHLPEAPGPCRGLVKRFFFDSEIQQCKHFYYGGCFGNANNFRSMDQCQRRCQNQDELTAATEVHVMSVRKPIMVQPTITTAKLTVSEPQVQLNVSNQQQNERKIIPSRKTSQTDANLPRSGRPSSLRPMSEREAQRRKPKSSISDSTSLSQQVVDQRS
ncbi:hypothetical protein CHARACLAT_008045, partial [Characodon lateralis]|nr:hypothetical protein [Characodon lateralis]